MEEMLSGKLYNPINEELIKLQNLANNTCIKFNFSNNLNFIKQLFKNSQSEFLIRAPFYCDFGINIVLGKNVFINCNCVFLDCNVIKIGNNTVIGPNTHIYTVSHPIDVKLRKLYLQYTKPVSIGCDCWIGGNVTILPGITIGNNVVVGAGSVVTKSIPDNVVAVGNPCRIIKYLK